MTSRGTQILFECVSVTDEAKDLIQILEMGFP